MDYELGRPGWPAGVTTVVDLAPEANVIDLGAGTGKLTRLLAAAFGHVVAVEPAEAMRRLLLTECPGVEALAGTAEKVHLPDASVEAVFVGQAFQHFDEERAIAEVARVLRPGGALVLLWNLPAGPWRPPSAAGAEEVLSKRMPSVDYIPLDLGGPDASSGWEPAVTVSPFEPFRATVLPNPQALDRDGLVAFYATMGWIADLPDHERLPLLEQVRARLDSERYERTWETHVHWTRLPHP